MLLFKAMAQRRAAKRQRAAQSLMQRAIQDNRYKESVRAAIYQKRAAAESKRMGILEAERRRANTRLRQVFGAASSVQSQKEAERRKMKDRLEERLQRVCLKAQPFIIVCVIGHDFVIIGFWHLLGQEAESTVSEARERR